MTTYSPVKHQDCFYRVSTTSTPNNHTQSAISVRSFNLHATEKLTTTGKEYMCFKIDGKSSQSAKYVKSRIKTKVIDCVLSIDKFEEHCVVLKRMSQSLILVLTNR